MLERVGQCFLDDAVGGTVDCGGERFRVSERLQPHGQAGPPHGLEQPVDVGEPGMRSERRPAVGGVEQAEQPRKLVERFPADVLNRAQGLACPLGRAVEHLIGGAGLQRHDADRVRHGVVQLARHAGAFVQHGEPCSRVALARKPLREDAEFLGLTPVNRDRASGGQRDAEDRHRKQHVRGVSARGDKRDERRDSERERRHEYSLAAIGRRGRRVRDQQEACDHRR
jgi:hypothetical protein